jgi:ankyrin repeat protein
MLKKQTCEVDELLELSREQDEELLVEIKAMRGDQKEFFKTKEEMACFRSLRTTAYEDTMEKNPDRVPGTCEWFLRHERYCEWLDESASNLLWVTADPGCGKSILSKFLINDYRSWMWTDTSVCYFFFKDDSNENKSAIHVLCAILHQLFRQNHVLLKYAVTEYKSNGDKLPQVFEFLWSILIKAAADPDNGNIVCIVDAPDECDESSCEKLIKCLADFHSKKRKTARLKFLVTSRPNNFVNRVFCQQFSRCNQDPTSVKLMGENDCEIEEIGVEINIVIDEKIKDFKRLRGLYGVDDVAVREQLKKVENRTYLWISLIFPELEKMAEYAKDELLKAIQRVPPTLDQAYERILRNSSDVGKARRLLRIVYAASRPLTLAEMNRALSIHDDGYLAALTPPQSFSDIVRSLCGLFVSILHSKIYLIHQTAKEFLICENDAGRPVRPVDSGKEFWKHSLKPTESNLFLAKICMLYLLFPEFESDPLVINEESSLKSKECIERCENEHDFLDYSAKNWASHLRAAKIKEIAAIKLALEICNTRSKRFQTWFRVYWTTIETSSFYLNFTDLKVGSYFGLEAVARLLLEKPVNMEPKDAYGLTPPSLAAGNGHEAVVKLLLEKGAKADSKDYTFRTPLSWAARNGHVAVVKLLLKEVGKLLFNKAVNLESKDYCGQTPLSFAASNGHEAMVKLLHEKGSKADSKDNVGRTPLSFAAANGHEAVVKMWLEKAVNVDSKDYCGETPLSLAAKSGHEAVMKLLLGKAVDVDSKDNMFD